MRIKRSLSISLNSVLPLLAALMGLLPLFGGLPVARLEACAMSALIARRNCTLDTFPVVDQVPDYWDYNDPWDYFAFVMANSFEHYNDDGYGVAVWRDNDPVLRSRGMWYKRVLEQQDFGGTYYTGQYLQYGGQFGLWEQDILDQALLGVQSGEGAPVIALLHARNASGLTYGNHPFWFNYGGRSFGFMHNGVCNNARTFMINAVNQLHPDLDWFASYPSNHFNNHNPAQWVDSEVLFHYIMAHIMAAGGNVLSGLQSALRGIETYLISYSSGAYNFIMTDGSQLYAFRNTPPNSSYRLSYRSLRGQIYALRTLVPDPEDTEIKQMELVVFSRTGKPRHYPNFTHRLVISELAGHNQSGQRHKPEFIPPLFSVGPNPFFASTTLHLRLDEPGRLQVKIFNLRGELVWETTRDYALPCQAHMQWDGQDRRGRKLPPGIYLLRGSFGRHRFSLRLSLARS